MSQRVNSTSTASFTADTAILQLDGYSKFSYWRTANVIMPSLQQALLQPLRDLLPQLHAVHMATDFILGHQQPLTQSQQQRMLQILPAASARTQAALSVVDELLSTNTESGPQDTLDLQTASVQAASRQQTSAIKPPCVLLWVVPRLGTISAWSSKASDILHRCALPASWRLESAQLYALSGVSTQDLDPVRAQVLAQLHDPLTQSVLTTADALSTVFYSAALRSQRSIPFVVQGKAALQAANLRLGLALSAAELTYLQQLYTTLQRDPTDTELMMFAQVNSEHCRHKIFNSKWQIDGQLKPHTLFQMIRHTHRQNPRQAYVAYDDNAAVLKRAVTPALEPEIAVLQRHTVSAAYQYHSLQQPWVLKVETHNHPTAIAPFAGAATGSGGEIRDEAAVGRGGRSKAGMAGYMVSHLHLPQYQAAWEQADDLQAPHLASALQIMLQAPLGAAAFNNEFGRPQLCGFFRSFYAAPSTLSAASAGTTSSPTAWGYVKPIMIAGGIGSVDYAHIKKRPLQAGQYLVVLGGEAMAIGLGGGAASSRTSDSGAVALDFASVQRANPEMQRRAQEVIDACCAAGDANPIQSIHDVGAGGLCNAMPELVDADALGAIFDLQYVPSLESAMSPLEIWCNEAQERYVLAIDRQDWPGLQALAARERCPCAVIGEVRLKPHLQVRSTHHQQASVVDLAMTDLLGKIPLPVRCDQSLLRSQMVAANPVTSDAGIADAVTIDGGSYGVYSWPSWDVLADRILSFPAVASKRFLISIADRTVGGLTAREQMVGPWQVPVADVAVTAAGFQAVHGEAMAVGERAPLSIYNPAAQARMAVAEALTNVAAADIEALSSVVLSANWMADAAEAGQGAALYAAVEALGMDFCPALGISIPVGKDSLSMRSQWVPATAKTAAQAGAKVVAEAGGAPEQIKVSSENINHQLNDEAAVAVQPGIEHKRAERHQVSAPLTTVITAAAPVRDIGRTLTPQLDTADATATLWLIDLAAGQQRLAGSVLWQVAATEAMQQAAQSGCLVHPVACNTSDSLAGDAAREKVPDCDAPARMRAFFALMQQAHTQQLLLAYHDRSDGGLLATLSEMMFASHCGLAIDITALGEDAVRVLCHEELGAVVQVAGKHEAAWLAAVEQHGLSAQLHALGAVQHSFALTVTRAKKVMLERSYQQLRAAWEQPAYAIAQLRDNPQCAAQEHARNLEPNHHGLAHHLSFDPKQSPATPYINTGAKPRMAICREQGVNGYREMAAAFMQAGFACYDVHMSDLQQGRMNLLDFDGAVFCGGFSYGDVLGAGRGWAQSILQHAVLSDQFAEFFHCAKRFALGVCNGCQMLAHLRSLIPGAESWPYFLKNESLQFEARLVSVKINPSPSILLAGMEQSILPVVVAHGEGKISTSAASQAASSLDAPLLKDLQQTQQQFAMQACMQYVDDQSQVTMTYPDNPNGSYQGATAFCNTDGRITLMMPHPERVFRLEQFAWHPAAWQGASPWQRLFDNARAWLG